MRYIGVDYGSRKIGIAISDETGRFAFPHSVIKNTPAFRGELLRLAQEHNARVILGDSRSYDGSENPIAKDIKELERFLSRHGVTTAYEPELYTSQAALRIQGRTDMTDASAAALILNGYLERIHSNNKI